MWLWHLVSASASERGIQLRSPGRSFDAKCLATNSSFEASELQALCGRSVLLQSPDQLAAAIALIELDGVARRVVLVPPGVPEAHLPAILRIADVDACVVGRLNSIPTPGIDGLRVLQRAELTPTTLQRHSRFETEWVLLTSGTTGIPKLVLHTLASLTAAFVTRESPRDVRWATFYDIRRYGGLQIFLRAMQSGSLVLSSLDETPTDFAARVAQASVTHISGTPSHWRRFLMSGASSSIKPAYVRISGEIADQTLLDSLRVAFPGATVAHAFASTEAGVGFEIEDGLAGFSESLVGTTQGRTTIDVKEGRLRLRSPGNAQRYLGAEASQLKDPDGFVPTGDQLELINGRYLFVGRSGGVINVGGLKVHPEEVEAVLNTHPRVSMSLVKARRSPITGAIVVADIVLRDSNRRADETDAEISREILAACTNLLAAHKVPAAIRIVANLETTASGKLVRPNA